MENVYYFIPDFNDPENKSAQDKVKNSFSLSRVAHTNHTLRKLWQEGYEFEARLSYIVKPSLRKTGVSSSEKKKNIFKDILKLKEPKGRF